MKRMSEELERLSRVVGKEGKISQRAEIGEVTGAWKESVESVNALISDLVHPDQRNQRASSAPVAKVVICRRPWPWKSKAGPWPVSSCAPPRP